VTWPAQEPAGVSGAGAAGVEALVEPDVAGLVLTAMMFSSSQLPGMVRPLKLPHSGQAWWGGTRSLREQGQTDSAGRVSALCERRKPLRARECFFFGSGGMSIHIPIRHRDLLFNPESLLLRTPGGQARPIVGP
jgi:hypothetical protein